MKLRGVSHKAGMSELRVPCVVSVLLGCTTTMYITPQKFYL